MPDLAHQIFRLIVLHNKLMSEKDLDFYLDNGQDPEQCLERMVASSMFEQHVADKLLMMYRKKLAKECAKRGEPVPTPATPAESDDGSIPLALNYVDDLNEHDLHKADEVEWVDTSEHDTEKDVKHINDSERLDISDDFEVHAIVKGDENAELTKPSATPSTTTAHTLTVGASDSEGRVASPIPPGQIHPLAMKLVQKGVELNVSDIHLTSGSPPFFRMHGQLVFTEMKPLASDVALEMVLGFMDDDQQQIFLKTHDLDFSLEFEGLGRFRVNALQQFRGPSIIFRVIPTKIPTLESLGLPQTLARFTEYHQGLVLVTGPAGCGKTTTAAAMINLINQSREDHIITVEDPVEFLHVSQKCNVTQRQVPIHTGSFATALKAALREDPDVIMIGEMRDLETVSLAIRAAETGHLVIGTLQTKSAARTIDRVIDVFPEDQQAQIRSMLSESLRGIISQQLIRRKDGKGRVVALEVLDVVTAVSNLIRDAKTYQLPSLMQTGRKQGQVKMDDSLIALIDQGLITKEDAMRVAETPKMFK